LTENKRFINKATTGVYSMANEKEAPKERDISQIVRYLTATLNQAVSKLERPFRNTKTGQKNEAYIIQTEFAYLLNDVMQGPRCMVQKHIADCNEFIDQVVQELAKRETA
jgi:hypothetical protein